MVLRVGTGVRILVAGLIFVGCSSAAGPTGGGPPDTGQGGSGGGSAGGSGGGEPAGGTDAAATLEDAAPPAAEAGPGPDASASGDGGPVAGLLFEFTDPLPPIVQSHPSGDVSWFEDPMEGRVLRFRAVDDSDAKERSELDMPKDILKNGDTVWVGWKARLEIPNPGQEWRNIFQEKSYGSYQENVPFCLRADRNALRMLDPNAKEVWTHPLILGTWFTIVMKIVYGTGQMGTLEIWIDGEPQKMSNGSTVAHLGTWGGGQQNMHWGVYRRGSVGGTDVHYVSHLRVATTQALATPP
jgi:hypothetical protein